MNALVLGGASCVWEDLEQLRQLIGGDWPGIVLAVNDLIALYPGHLDHGVSLHPDKLAGWMKQRRDNGFNADVTTWCHPEGQPPREALRIADRFIPQRGAGSSVMLATRAALELRATHVVLVGAPMDCRAHIVRGVAWKDAPRYAKAWEQYRAEFGAVRSMSGYTRTLLGAPTREWLEV